MSFFASPVIGEHPARVAAGAITDTLNIARAYKLRDRGIDLRKQARLMRQSADCFDRQAVFATEERKPTVAAKARAEAARLRALADSMEADAAQGNRTLCVNGGDK